MGNISINVNNLEERATALGNAGKNINKQSLEPIDDESTISANGNARKAFEEAQQGHNLFAEAIEESSVQIKGIGERFFDIDSQGANAMGMSLER